MRLMSFSLTTQQIRSKMKTVTRRLKWLHLKAGDRIQACEKCMGRKKGEPLMRLCVIEVVSVRREALGRMIWDTPYGLTECELEGFAQHPTLRFPSCFVPFFCESHKGCTPATTVSRIEFRYV